MGWFSDLFKITINDYDIGFKETFSLGFYIELLHKCDGWYLWKIVNGSASSLMLIKSDSSIKEPTKPAGNIWCFGGKGFYVTKSYSPFLKEDEFYAGFYGRYQYRGTETCVVKGNLIDTYFLTEAELISMNGEEVDFEVSSSPVQSNYKNEKGKVSFVGIDDAFEALNAEYDKLKKSTIFEYNQSLR
jgi:hypothetical protein